MCKSDAVSSLVKGKEPVVFSLDDLATHNRPADNWIAIEGKVYDVSTYMQEKHPGGRFLPLQLAGRDATPLFRSTHPAHVRESLSRNPSIKMKGVLCEAPQEQFHFESEFYDVLQQRVDAYFKDNKLSRTFHAYGSLDNYVKLALMVALWVPGWYFAAGWGVVVAQAVVTQLFCFSVMHTNNHGALTSSDAERWGWDCVVDTCGGVSTLAWRHLHNTGHHFDTNIPERDNDIQNAPWLRFSVRQPKYWWHRYQHLYGSVLMCMFPALKMEFKHSYIAATLPNVDPMDRLRWASAKAFYWTFFLLLPAYWHGWAFALAAVYVRYVVCSFLYTHIIAPTHITEHCQHVTERDWFKHQVYTSSDSAPGDTLTNWFTAGLSHQIEHHLFPMIHHLHYPAIQPIIQQTVKEYKLPYNSQRNLATAVQAYWHWLYEIGRAA